MLAETYDRIHNCSLRLTRIHVFFDPDPYILERLKSMSKTAVYICGSLGSNIDSTIFRLVLLRWRW